MLRLEVSPAGVRDSVIAMAEPGTSGDQEARHLIEISAGGVTIRVRCWVEPAILTRHFASGDVRPREDRSLPLLANGRGAAVD